MTSAFSNGCVCEWAAMDAANEMLRVKMTQHNQEVEVAKRSFVTEFPCSQDWIAFVLIFHVWLGVKPSYLRSSYYIWLGTINEWDFPGLIMLSDAILTPSRSMPSWKLFVCDNLFSSVRFRFLNTNYLFFIKIKMYFLEFNANDNWKCIFNISPISRIWYWIIE